MKENKHLKSKIFGNKKLSDLIEEAYTDFRDTKETVTSVIEQIAPHLNTQVDLHAFLPHVKNMLDCGLKNGSNFNGMLTTVVRVLTTEKDTLTDAEESSFEKEIQQYLKQGKQIKDELTNGGT